MSFQSLEDQALVDPKGTSRRPHYSLPCLRKTGVEVQGQPLVFVTCRKLCLAFSVFSCPLPESPSPENSLTPSALSLSSLYQNKFCKGPNVDSSILRKIQNTMNSGQSHKSFQTLAVTVILESSLVLSLWKGCSC